MRHYSVGYTLVFSAAVCIICSLFVSSAAVGLKTRQQENIVLDKQKSVLKAASLYSAKDKLSREEIKALFASRIEPAVVDLKKGEYATDVDAMTYDQQAALKDATLSTAAPEGNAAKVVTIPNRGLIYKVKDEAGQPSLIILPIEGKGLWSTLYGFVALDVDLVTVKGLIFYQHGETPGLGGEVDNPSWRAKWEGRTAFDENGEPAIKVVKGVAKNSSEVDGLSGATLTCNGVTNLVQFWLGENGFGPFLAAERVK